MSDYPALAGRIRHGEVIILDGAVGTQLQEMGVPMNNRAWAALALKDHPFTVRRMHENYIKAGVDVITVNTYAAARHNLEPLGLAELTFELNLRAVMLAQDARDACAKDRPVHIAGSVSNFGLLAGSESGWCDHPYFHGRTETSERQARTNLCEQAEMLAEAGVDFLLAESTGSNTQRKWVSEACRSTGLPMWVGFRCRLDEDDPKVKVGYHDDTGFLDEFDDVLSLGGEVVNVFHSTVASTDAALAVVRDKWTGPLGVYPEAERKDYVAAYRDQSVPTRLTPEEFLDKAKSWVNQGVQVVGGCCGVELDYIRPLRNVLPTHVPR